MKSKLLQEDFMWTNTDFRLNAAKMSLKLGVFPKFEDAGSVSK